MCGAAVGVVCVAVVALFTGTHVTVAADGSAGRSRVRYCGTGLAELFGARARAAVAFEQVAVVANFGAELLAVAADRRAGRRLARASEAVFDFALHVAAVAPELISIVAAFARDDDAVAAHRGADA